MKIISSYKFVSHKILFFNKEKKCANKLIKLKSIYQYSIKFDADQQLNAPKKIRTIY